MREWNMTSDGDRIRAALIDAVSSGDRQRMAELCTVHRATIARDFPAWTQVPVEPRGDPATVQRYARALMRVAHFFDTQLGDSTLLEAMSGPPEANPIVTWQGALGQAQKLMGELRYAEARQLLFGTLADIRGLTGSAVDSLLPVTHGMLGQCCFQLGEAAAALDPTTAALRLCQEHGDQEGILAYQGNLFEIHRYLGRAGEAADAAQRCAEALTAMGRARQAEAWQRHARLVRAGEPLNRVVALVDNDERELDEVQSVSGQQVHFIFKRNRLTLEPARRRTGEGEQIGAQGHHAEAHTAFQEAARLDPFDPHPRYLSGLALLHLRRYHEAVVEYGATERLAPGWFNCRADLWLARELARGAMDHGLYQVVYLLEDSPMPPQEKVRMAEGALRTAPRLAPLHLFYGHNLATLGAQAEAETAYRNGLGCVTEPDVRTQLLVALGMTVPSERERVALLSEAAAATNGNLISAAMATLALRTR